jgi:hypothetical protein
MRPLLLLLVLAIAVAMALVAVRARNRLTRRDEPRAVEPARWRVAHVSRQGVTHVLVRREVASTGQVLDEREVATVNDDDPDYDAKFMEATATARARAEVFNDEDR